MRKLQGRISKSPIPDQKKVSPSRGAGGKFTSRPAEQSAPLANQEHWRALSGLASCTFKLTIGWITTR
jgi:hypothetical protein